VEVSVCALPWSRQYAMMWFGAGTLALAGCADKFGATDCERGYRLAHEGDFAAAKKTLSRCLAAQDLSSSQKRSALIAQAWVHGNLDDELSAATSYDEAFRIAPAADYREMINASVSYRYAKRYKDALQMNIAAAELDGGKYADSMMIQYQLGWSYQLNGEHELAVAAFTKGIPLQPDFAYALWRRALSYEALGRSEKAKADLLAASSLFLKGDLSKPLKPTLKRMHQEVADSYKRFGLQVPAPVASALLS
jgi:tetratricopeptide (TPR) repeat protein